MKYEVELNQLKDDLDKAKNLKYQAEARLEELERQEKQIIEELKALGVEPENLKKEIDKLEKDIKDLFIEANSYIPKDLI